MKKIVNWLLVVAIIIGVIFIKDKYFPKVITTTITDTIWKDSITIQYIPKGYPIYIDTSRIDTVYIPTDTAELVARYLKLHQNFYSSYLYKDTLLNDTSAFIEVETKISQNKPLNYRLTYFDKTPTVINNITNIYAKNEYFVGLNNAAPSFLFKHKKGYMIGAGYDLLNKDERFRVQVYVELDNIKKLW